MDAKKMLALLGAMAVTATAVPVVAAPSDADTRTSKEQVVLYSGNHTDGQNVNWHSSHGSHGSHGSHSSHSSHSSSRW